MAQRTTKDAGIACRVVTTQSLSERERPHHGHLKRAWMDTGSWDREAGHAEVWVTKETQWSVSACDNRPGKQQKTII